LFTLYELPVSSYCCKTRIILDHKGIEWVSAAPPDGYGSEAYRAIIPAGTIPAIDHNGFRLTDSEAIGEYLDETVKSPGMLPIDARLRARARETSRFHDTRLEPLLRGCFAHVALSNRDPEIVLANLSLLATRLGQLSLMVAPSPLLFGDQLTITDCGFVPTFALIKTLSKVFDFDLDVPQKLVDYEKALTAHPSVKDHNTAYYASLDAWVSSKIG